MPQPVDSFNPDLTVGQTLSGFSIERIVPVKALGATIYTLQHQATGTRYLHISRDDRENSFSVIFKTVPQDSSGVTHILEHTVFCGSRQYPVRDPFFSMLKRSLSTFMNAFTASDWTMYPFSTQNRKDFYNLLGVYLDAAFFPNLDRLSFKQEGHRLEFEKDQLVRKGVVYNEMKGAMSSPHEVMGRSLLNALYPDTTYQYNSGGDPEVIPDLTWEQLKAFHQVHYHPGNAYFYTYGDMPVKAHLAFIADKVLGQFDAIAPNTSVPSQPRWRVPKEVSYPYPLAADEDPTRKYQACLAWLTADIQDTFEVLALVLLEHILLANAASPLRKTLLDSGLGDALSDGTGYDADNRDTLFTCGLKGVAQGAIREVEQLILDCLNQLVKDGVDPELAHAAIHQLELLRREVTNTPYPHGLKLLLGFTAGWIHGGDPLRYIDFDADIEKLKNALAAGRFFEARIEKWLLHNPHRVRFMLTPDQQLNAVKLTKEIERLKAAAQALSADEKKKIEQDTQTLAQLQGANEDLSVLPMLKKEEIPAQIETVHPESCVEHVTVYKQPTSGITYFTTTAGAGHLDAGQIPLIPFFCFVLPKLGTARRDYTAMARRIAAYTGGIGLKIQARTHFEAPYDCIPFATLSGKALDRNISKLFDIAGELMAEALFDDAGRLQTLLQEYRAHLEAAVIQSGHRYAISLAARHFSQTHTFNEAWSGIHQLRAVKELAQSNDNAGLTSSLANIVRVLFGQPNVQSAVIGGDGAVNKAMTQYPTFLQRLPQTAANGFGLPLGALNAIPYLREGWYTASTVSFVAQVMPTVRMDHTDAPVLAVIAKLLRSAFLHREIREKGGAYGGFALYHPEDGLFALASYRDPHIVRTLNVFKEAGHYICSGRYDEIDVHQAILQVASEIDKPDAPGQAAQKAFFRQILGLTDELRQQFKEGVLAISKKKVVDTAKRYFQPPNGQWVTAVISGKEQLEAANEQMQDEPFDLQPI